MSQFYWLLLVMITTGVRSFTVHFCSQPGVVLHIFALYYLAMQLLYSRSELKCLDCHALLDPASYNVCWTLGRLWLYPPLKKRPFIYLWLWCTDSDHMDTQSYAPRCHKNWRMNCDHFCPLAELVSPSLPGRLNCNIAHLNAWSITNKAWFINDLITQKKLDMFFLSETWQQPGDFLHRNMLTPPGYSYLSKPWLKGRGVVWLWFIILI